MSNAPAHAASPADEASDSFSLDQLSSDHLDVPRWINASLHDLAPLPDCSETDSDAALESRVTRLLSRLQSYSQEVAGGVEDAVTQALVRLPRTGLEVARMATEAHQLHEQLRNVQETMEPAMRAAAQPCVARLNGFKRTQEKLARCADMLRKASEVDARMRQLDNVMQRLRAAPTEVDVDAVAESIREVRGNLAELRELEPSFGEKQLEALSRCEQSVQQAVEAECGEQIRRRDAQGAGRLLKVLDAVGRADAVLQQYAHEAIARERERMAALLGPLSDAPARAADVLRVQLIPAMAHTLLEELGYAQRMAADAAPHIAKARAQRVAHMIVREASDAVAESLGPIIERSERNADLIACYEAVRQMGPSGERAAHSKKESQQQKQQEEEEESAEASALRERLWQEAVADFAAEMARLFARPQTMEAFAQREVARVAAALSDAQCTAQRERFRPVMDALGAAVRRALHFFPGDTLPMCVGPWRDALVEAVGRLRPGADCDARELLRRLSAAHAVVRPLVLAEQRGTLEALEALDAQGLCHPQPLEETGTGIGIGALLRSQLWQPLVEAVDDCAAECQRAVKRTVAAPVVAKAVGYDVQHVWGGTAQQITQQQQHQQKETLVPYAQAQAAPSELVRALGEAIVEIPLALEALRGDGDAQLYGIDELLEEVAEAWLDDIVRVAVTDFVGEKVARVIIDFPGQGPDGARKEAAAVEQLATDLGYLRSILSAVSDDPFDELERTLARLKTIALPVGKPIVIRNLIEEAVSA